MELFTGMNFPQRCDSQCQLSALNRITAKMNSFDYSSDPLITFIPSSEDPIEYSIHNIFIRKLIIHLYQTYLSLNILRSIG